MSFPTTSLFLSHANSLICGSEKTSGKRGEKNGDMNLQLKVSPLYSKYTLSLLHPILSLSSPAHLNKLTPLDALCACTVMHRHACANT